MKISDPPPSPFRDENDWTIANYQGIGFAEVRNPDTLGLNIFLFYFKLSNI